MKLTILHLVLGVCVCSANNIYSQSTTLSFNINNKTVKDVFDEIEKKSEYVFFYYDGVLDVNRKVNLNIRDKTVDKILDELFSSTDNTYVIADRQIFISKKATETESAQQQLKIRITGVVTDEDGETMPGVSILIKGSKAGTVTDVDGNYFIEVPDENTVLIFSFLGYTPWEFPVKKQRVINIKLTESSHEIDEVVVVGFGQQRKESLTSAITSVETGYLENRSTPKLATALQGITPGVNIRQTTGRPGYSATTFDIRGASLSTFSENKPLILIDGIVDNIDNVNPEDVEKISILKDAAAAAIYGSRATGGVVLITTKKGATGKPTVNYSVQAGFQQLPFGNYKFISSAEWMRANNEAFRLDGGTSRYTDEEIAKYENSTDPQYPAKSQWTDWVKKTTPQITQTLSIRGGNEKLNFYTSLGYVDQEGMIDNDTYKKVNFLTNLNYEVSSRFDLNTSVSFIKEFTTRPVGDVYTYIRNAFLNPPVDPFYLSNGDYNNQATLGANPAYLTKEEGNTKYEFNSLRMSLTAKYNLLEGLFIRYTFATNMTYNLSNLFTKKIPFRDNNGDIYGYNRSEIYVKENWDRSNYYSNLVMADYTKRWEDHNFSVMGGFQTEEYRKDDIQASASKFPNNEIREISASTGTGSDISGMTSASDWALASLIGRLTYSFRDKYLFEGTVRYDGSSRFAPDNRWAFFPSVSASWRMKEESFLRDVSFLSNLKLRASWGELGNQGTNLYPFAMEVNTSKKYPLGNGLVPIATIGSPVNPYLTWEAKKTTNFGLDYGFFNNRLSGSFDYFLERTDGIIGRPTVPTTYGAEAPIQNTYIIDNKGFEFEIRWMDKINDFTYHVGFNLSDAKDKIVSLGGIGTTDPAFGSGLVQKSNSTYNAEGKPRNSLYLYRTNGLFVNQAEIDNHAFISNLTRPGDIVFIDTDGSGTITPTDKVADNQTTTPHHIFGFNLGAEYKNFDLSMVLSGVWTRWAYRNNGGHYLTGVRATLSILETNYKNRWTEENPDKWADQPRLTQNNWIANEYSTLISGPCEYHLRNFGYLRLRNVQLGYTLPRNISEKIYMSRLRCYVTAENLFTYTPGYKEPIDPESVMDYQSDGSAFFGVPRVFSFGLSVTF